MMIGAEILIKALEGEGVKEIFGYPGGAVLEIFEKLNESDIHLTLVRNEQGAAHAASGYAKAKGEVGVCLSTSGPGATNLVTGIATAYMDSVPLVVLTGQVSTKMIGTDAFQEIDITGITNPIVKYNLLVKRAEDLPKIIKEAFYIAKSGRPGPVVIDIPRDVSLSEVGIFKPHDKVEIRSYNPTLYGHQGMIKKACELIKKAKKMLIISGGGVINAEASEALEKLIHLKPSNVCVTMMGLGSVSPDEATYLGMLGTYGNQRANEMANQADLILALGTRFDDRIINAPNLFAKKAKIIHVDIDPAEIGKNIKVEVPIVGDIKNVLEAFLTELSEASLEKSEILEPTWSNEAYDKAYAQSFLRRLDSLLESKDVIYVTDVGQHQVWAAKTLKCKRPRSFITSGGLGTMGYGLPASIGAKKASPESEVILITGDGSIQMLISEFATLKQEGLDIKIILLNNGKLGMVRQLQHHYCDKNYVGIDLEESVDFSLLAKAYGLNYFKFEKEMTDEILSQYLSDGSIIIEVPISEEDLCLPVTLAGSDIDDMVTLP